MTTEIHEAVVPELGTLIPQPRKGEVIPIDRGRTDRQRRKTISTGDNHNPLTGAVPFPPETLQLFAALNAPGRPEGFIALEGPSALQTILSGGIPERRETVEVTIYSGGSAHADSWSEARLDAERKRRSRIASGELRETRGRRRRARQSVR